MWPWHMGYGWSWGGALVAFILMLLFWGILIALAVVIIRSLSRSNRQTGWSDNPEIQDRTPLDILKERYARGEISRQEYQSIRREIEMP